MPTDREQLGAIAKRCGYGKDTLTIIATVAVPSFEPGTRMEDEQVTQVVQALEVLELLGYPNDALAPMVQSFQNRYKTEGDWRFEFWRVMLRRASLVESRAVASPA